MRDVTTTSFGLVIAYLLPGLLGLYSLGFWSTTVEQVFDKLMKAQSNVWVFLLVILTSLMIGLWTSVVRYLLFERWGIFKRYIPDRLDSEDFARHWDEPKFFAFRAMHDEHFRHHQFWGGMAVVLPLYYLGWLKTSWSTMGFSGFIFSALLLIGVEVVNIVGAIAAYNLYVIRGRAVLKGG